MGAWEGPRLLQHLLHPYFSVVSVGLSDVCPQSYFKQREGAAHGKGPSACVLQGEGCCFWEKGTLGRANGSDLCGGRA